MRILIAEDDYTSRIMLGLTLEKWGYRTIAVSDGHEALKILQSEDRPEIAVLDWMMPEISGPEICQKLRESSPSLTPVYILLLTSRGRTEDIIMGLESGANDYVTKPFNREELHARIRVGERVVTLQKELFTHAQELKDALSHIKVLQGMLPICAHCKKIRDDKNYWHSVEEYISTHTDSQFTHSICPGCYEKYYEPTLGKLEE